MTNQEMIKEYYEALRKLQKRHDELQAEIRVYDKRIVLLEEEIDEIYEVIAALKKLQAHSQPMRNQNTAAASMYINDPLRKGFFDNLFSTHPPLEKRIERIENGKYNF